MGFIVKFIWPEINYEGVLLSEVFTWLICTTFFKKMRVPRSLIDMQFLNAFVSQKMFA